MARGRTPQMVTSSVESVHMAFYTDEEVRGMSAKEITTPILFDNLGRPVPGGLFDPAMGPWKDDPGNCKTCGEPPLHCPGHCGHINLVLPVYNPLLFKTLQKLLKLTCFYCNHLMISKERVRVFVTKLHLIMKGDVVDARNLDSMLLGVSNPSEKDEDLVGDCSKGRPGESLFMEQHSWTSLQHSEAKSIFKAIMSESSAKKCGNCGAKNPKIVSPGFGLLYKEGLTEKDIQSNFIRGSKADISFAHGEENKYVTDENQAGEFSSEPSGGEISDSVTHGEQQPKSKSKKSRMNKIPHEFLSQKDYFNKRTYLTPLQVQDMLRLLWKNEHNIFSLIWALQPNFSATMKNRSFSMFFLQALLVPPSRFRPPNEVNTSPQNILLSRVLQSNISLADALKDTKPGHSISLQNLNQWIQLQEAVNVLFDSSKATSRSERTIKGICQILDKKDGLFRQNMMGKRVNFACRSVISPDPYLAVNEIGIPPYFAMRLTYPEKVTPWNADRLRKAILNGPYVYPGAVRVEDVQGVTHLDRPITRRAVAKKLCSSSAVSRQHRLEGKVVHRHLQDGDILLVNRQPTLHKPSMMAHVARVLKGEKTLRMHYANCSTYNADFDGDEMNVHFPQDEIARAEAYNIVNANEQYIVPTKGEPIRGLIQDHIASSVLLTKKDTFLTREEYHHLLYSACAMVNQGEISRKCCMIKSERDIHPILPAIWKPYPLWTGKQIITTILNHVTHGMPPFTVENVAKIHDYNIIPKGCQGDANTLHRQCLISKNEFLYGVIDKAQYGKYGLVHMVQELYGENTAGLLLSILSRLFTAFLQMHGFTCGVDDLLLVPEAEVLRTESTNRCESIGESVHSKFLGVEYDQLDPLSLQREIENVLRTNGESATERLDALMSSELNELTNELNKKLFPDGLLKPFPNNCVFLMTASGAKGSNVNFIQISSLLGQQELEGKRVPRMISGKTLPCFPPWDTAPRAGGFISDRFLTGLHPQEYYFHCMAGRDGLVDTAIKTSRSGYLQRCLVKNLECLKVCYDYTVRDADGSIVQFYYGEDGVDVLKSSCLTEFKILAANQEILLERLRNGHSLGSDLLESNGYISCLPELLQLKAENFIRGVSEDQKRKLKLRKPKEFMNLVKLKYATSLAHAGEAVGVIAAQSIGEPSTQMTLNTFHLAGRGEGNVTLGMPRLREILMTASKNILTPLMICPLLQGKTRSDAECVAAKLKRIRFSDIIESMDVSVVPCFIGKRVVSTVYKLKLNLCGPDMHPPHANITNDECEDAFENKFVPLLKKAVDKYLDKMSKSGEGIEIVSEHPEGNVMEKAPDENEPENESIKGEGTELDEDEGEDEGADAQKRKKQSEDDIEYDDEIENELSAIEDVNSEDDEMVDSGKEGDEVEDGLGTCVDGDGSEILEEALNDVSKNLPVAKSFSGSKVAESSSMRPRMDKLKSKTAKSLKHLESKGKTKTKTDARIIVSAGSCLEVHFFIMKGTYLLLSQFAEKIAMNVFIRTVEGIDDCSLIIPKGFGNKTNSQLNPGRKLKKQLKNMPEDLHENTEPIKLQTRGVNFSSLWRMQDELDIRKLCSNDINAMLEKYGVEAARETIVAEIRAVFERYGIRPDIRHLSLIADFMTFDGQYRPMNRFGISSSVSPFLKITFETATNFIVQMASHGEVEPLESPSARIAMGQPVKLGTGCFDLLQKLELD